MYFDQLCNMLERHFPDLAPFMEEAKVFYLPVNPHEMLQDELEEDQGDRLDLFRLPFPIIAVEDNASVVVIIDDDENNIGLNCVRHCIMYTPSEKKDGAYDPEKQKESKHLFGQVHESFQGGNKEFDGCLEFLDIFSISKNDTLSEWVVDGVYQDSYFVNKKYKSKSIKTMMEETLPSDAIKYVLDLQAKTVLDNASVAFREIFYFMNPNFFILKEEPLNAKPKKGKKKDMISRSHERPLYTALRPTQIREKLGLQQPPTPDRKRGSPVPHERRAHLRRLKKESGYKEDKVITVKASWIGDSEKIIGNKRYKVILDR